MCLAIYKPAGVKIPEDHLRNGWQANQNGAGFAYARDGRLHVRKGFMKLADLLAAWRKAEDYSAILHFRLATSGSRGPEMTHPFSVSDDLAMIHNGILSIQPTGNNSDTAEYVDKILAPMAKRDKYFFSRPDVQFIGEAAIRGSKFVFLHKSGKCVIWNEDDGHWRDGAWYSGHSYQGYQSVMGYRWYKNGKYEHLVKDDDTVVLGNSRAQEIWDERMREIDAQTGRSQFFSKLSKSDQKTYEDLVDEGWLADDLDDIISVSGPKELERLFYKQANDDTPTMEVGNADTIPF